MGFFDDRIPLFNNERKKMETLAINEASYNPHEMVTYKVIENGVTTYKQVKVTDLEFAIHTQKERVAKYERLIEIEKEARAV